MTQPINNIIPQAPVQEVKQYKTGLITLEVGVPNFIMQLFNGELITRLLTLSMMDDFAALSSSGKFRVMWKVAVVGLLTLGVCVAASIMNPLFIWAVPLCLIATMGLSFSLTTMPKNKEAAGSQETPAINPNNIDPKWGPGQVLGRGNNESGRMPRPR